jgi:hypothetical protein
VSGFECLETAYCTEEMTSRRVQGNWEALASTVCNLMRAREDIQPSKLQVHHNLDEVVARKCNGLRRSGNVLYSVNPQEQESHVLDHIHP